MKARTWVILGATSIIAREFAHLVAKQGESLRLVGRNLEQLSIQKEDLRLRYRVPCEVMGLDKKASLFSSSSDEEFDLFIAQSECIDNALLNPENMTELINVNILTTALIIHDYLKTKQSKHRLIFLSSVAAVRGRSKNSLYGGSKAAIEVYLQGLQQAASKTQVISIARLGYIDTKLTYGCDGIFYAASPKACAKACLRAVLRGKRRFYFPFFWQGIMSIVLRLPFFLFKKI